MEKFTQYRLEPDKGYLIVIEGMDGSGKSTIAKSLVNNLNLIGYNSIYVRNPGSTKVSEKIRNIVLNFDDLTDDERALLFTVAMSNTLREKVIPALKNNKIVIMDRYYHSLYIYQNFYKDTNRQLLFHTLYKSLTNLCKQDYFILAKASPEVCKSRVDERDKKDIFDSKDIEYFKNIHNIYYQDKYGIYTSLNKFVPSENKMIINTEDKIHSSISKILNFLKKS